MGAPTMSVQESTQPKGKGGPVPDSSKITFPGQGGQPAVGQPNQYSNTVGPWDNQNNSAPESTGKGKGV